MVEHRIPSSSDGPVVATARAKRNEAAATSSLKGAVALWFFTAVAGQWLFVFYIATFYGPTLVSGEFEAWDRNRMLTDGYVAGDKIGNLTFASHVLLAAVLTFGGALQLMPQIRDRMLAFHRWNGRVFIFAALAAACGGLWLEWVRGTGLRSPTGIVAALGVTFNALLIFAFAGLAWRAAYGRNIAAHRRWATRLFLVVNGVWFLRVGFWAWMTLSGGVFGAQPFFSIWTFGCCLLPLVVYESFLQARTAAASIQYAMAASLLVLTLIMGIGIVATFVETWRPLL